MAFSESNRVSWRFIAEVTFGVTPTTPTMLEILRTDGEFTAVTETVVSESVRADRMRQGLHRVGQHNEASFSAEFAYGQYDDLFQAVLCGTWATATLTATDIDAASADDSLNSAAAAFVSSGFVAGMWVLVSGLTVTAENRLYKIAAVTTAKMTFSASIHPTTGAYTTPVALTTEAAGASITIKSAGMLRNGTTARSFTFEEAYTDVSDFWQYRGVRMGDMTLTIEPKSLIKLDFTATGKSFSRTGSTIASVVTAPNSNIPFNATSDVIGMAEGGAAATVSLTQIQLMVKNNLRYQDAIGSLTPAGIGYGTQDITGQIVAYNDGSGTLEDKYVNFTETSQTFVLKNGSSPVYYIVTLPAYRYSGGSPKAGALNADSMNTLPFTAYKGADGFQIQVDKVSTT
jgi:hypothetical protein